MYGIHGAACPILCKATDAKRVDVLHQLLYKESSHTRSRRRWSTIRRQRTFPSIIYVYHTVEYDPERVTPRPCHPLGGHATRAPLAKALVPQLVICLRLL